MYFNVEYREYHNISNNIDDTLFNKYGVYYHGDNYLPFINILYIVDSIVHGDIYDPTEFYNL